MKKHKDLLETARQHMASAVNADMENREAALNDLEFLAGRQWEEDIRRARIDASRPALTINRLPRFVRQVTGDIRKLNPAIKILAADDIANDDGAELVSGLIRQIEGESGASSIYEGAAEDAAECSIGNFRVLTEYEHERSFDQVIRVKKIHNPLSVYWDPNARESTRSDADFCFITDSVSVDDFRKQYPKAQVEDAPHDGETDGLEHWHQDGSAIVAEYFWKEVNQKEIGLLRGGEVIEGDLNAALDLVAKRKVDDVKIKWAKISGQDVLEGPRDVPGKHIPVVAVVGEELHVGDRIIRTSVIRFAKDPQVIYNYMASAQAETVGLQPKAPWLVTSKHIAGLERFWKEANVANRPYLPYNPDDKAPAPSRVAPAVAASGITQEMMHAEDDMKATTGIYDAALGGKSNEQSGVAIRQRQLESDISTSIYTDNLAKSIERAGRIILDMIPEIYDTDRVIRILGEEGDQKRIRVNQPQLSMDGPKVLNPLTVGRYDVQVTVGPNYSTRRQETAESMMQFVQAFPPAGQVAGDLIAKSMDWPDADKLAERLKKTLPPGILPVEELPEEEQAQIQKKLQQQQQQMAQAQKLQAIMSQNATRKATAEAAEAEADANKATVEVAEAQLELAMKSGQMNAAISTLVQQEVARALQSAFAR